MTYSQEKQEKKVLNRKKVSHNNSCVGISRKQSSNYVNILFHLIENTTIIRKNWEFQQRNRDNETEQNQNYRT